MNSSFLQRFLILLFATVIGSADGSIIYTADFTPDDVGFTHTDGSPLASSSDSASTTNFTLSYDSAPQSDTTLNEFRTLSGEVRIQDWGGVGEGESSSIDVSTVDVVDIILLAQTLGGGANVSAEYFEWFYELDGGGRVEQLFDNNNQSNISHTFSSVDTSGASTLAIGFNFNIDGADTGFRVQSMNVNAVPEPSTIIFLSTFIVSIGGYRMLRKYWMPATTKL